MTEKEDQGWKKVHVKCRKCGKRYVGHANLDKKYIPICRDNNCKSGDVAFRITRPECIYWVNAEKLLTYAKKEELWKILDSDKMHE